MKIFSLNSLSRTGLVCLVAVIVLAAADTALACPSCQAALASQEGGHRVVQGFFWSILFMMSMPFSIFTALSTYFYVIVRRARREEVACAPAVVQVDAQRPRDMGF